MGIFDWAIPNFFPKTCNNYCLKNKGSIPETYSEACQTSMIDFLAVHHLRKKAPSQPKYASVYY